MFYASDVLGVKEIRMAISYGMGMACMLASSPGKSCGDGGKVLGNRNQRGLKACLIVPIPDSCRDL